MSRTESAKTERLGLLAGAVAALGILCVGVPQAIAADLPAAVKSLVAGAKKEGEVNIFGRTLKPAAVQEFTKRISAFYGFPIKLNMAGGFHTSKAAELELAVKKSVPTGIDVFWTSYATAVRMEKKGVLLKFDWPSLGIDQKLKASDYGIKSHDVSLGYINYNTNLVKDSEAPKTWNDLLNPKWKGRIVMPRSPATWIYVTTGLGEEKTAEVLTGLIKKNKVTMVAKFADVRTRVASGEFAIGIGSDSFRLMRQGAPVKMAPVSPIPLSNWAFYMIKDVKHPNLAKLWAYWITTDDGQKALVEVDGTAFASTKGGPLNKLVQGAKVSWLTRAYMMKNGRRLIKKYAKIMKIR